jgi:pantetheine-phosphate adenylyltransferase
MIIGVYAGSFDPPTFGHLDIIKRSAEFCDILVIGIGENSSKKAMFTIDQRVYMIKSMIPSDYDCPTTVAVFDGLLVNYAEQIGASFMIRGVRSAADFEYETNLANINKMLNPHIETIFLPTSPALSAVSSSAVKEILKHGGNVSKFLPPSVCDAIKRIDKDKAGIRT